MKEIHTSDISRDDDAINSDLTTRKSSLTKMFGKNGRFVTFILVLTFFCDKTSSECTQLTPCSCIFPNGQGYDLSPLSNSGYLTTFDSNTNLTFYFHPCTNIPIKLNDSIECSKGNGVSLCVKYNNDTFNLGTVEETKIAQSDNSKEPVLILHHGANKTTIRLFCCTFCKTHLVVDSVDTNTDYRLLLISPYVCKMLLHTKGLSTGSLLVIFFFTFSALYFIGGAITLKFLKGATGWEMVPNHQFWRNLSSLVRDGIAFTFNCCHAVSYDRI